MSIDHGKLLARLREIANGLADQQAMPDDTWERQWDEALATAQPAEAVDGAPIPDGYRVTEFIPGRWCWDLQDELGGWSGDGSYYGHYAAAAIGAWRDYADTLERAAMDEASAHDAAQGAVAWESKVGGLPAKWRKEAEEIHIDGSPVLEVRSEMLLYHADELEAALSAHGQPEPRVSQAMLDSQLETARLLDDLEKRSEARREKYGLHGQPVADEAWLRQAIEEFKYLAGRTDFPMQDRERWRALTAALEGATP